MAAGFAFQSPADHAAALAFFKGHDAGHALFHQVLQKVAEAGPFELAATKSRVALVARTRFAWCHEANDDGSLWLAFLLPRKVASPRLRSGLAGGRWSHHIKVTGPADLDDELVGWLREAYTWDVQGIKDARPPAKPRNPRNRGKTGGSPGSVDSVAASSAEWTCPRCGQGFVQRNARHSCDVQAVEEFFGPYPHGLPLVRAVLKALAAVGPVQATATKTQVSFRARTRFAWLWIPQMALKRGPPDVYLAFDLPVRLSSPRVKQSVEVRPGHWVHHMHLETVRAVDAEVKGWLRAAYDAQRPARTRAAKTAKRSD